MRRMHKGMCKVSIVCHYKQTFGFIIKSSDRDDPCLNTLEQFCYNRPSLRIFHGCNEPPRFVQDNVRLGLRNMNKLAADLYRIFFGVRLSSEFCDTPAIDGDPPLKDKLFSHKRSGGKAGC